MDFSTGSPQSRARSQFPMLDGQHYDPGEPLRSVGVAQLLAGAVSSDLTIDSTWAPGLGAFELDRPSRHAGEYSAVQTKKGLP